jgi:starch synthase (maltosyl-transferring)
MVDAGRFPVKRVVGEPVVVDAVVLADGHDALHVVLAHKPPGQAKWIDVPMWSSNPGLDEWRAEFTPYAEGLHVFRVQAWIDEFASWQHGTLRKLDAGLDVRSELLAGAAMLEAATASRPARDRDLASDAVARLRAGDTIDVTDPGGDDRPSAADLYRRSLTRRAATTSARVEVDVERERALFSSWYEMFPRSWSTDPDRRPHGNLRDVAAHVDYVADLGFDIVYLPPIHPIGRSFRKGPNNAEEAAPGDPGSPWAIGSVDGGHTSIHPELGTIDDLRHLVDVAAQRGIEVALDLAFQCSPDHPWVTEHPDWFRHRPDGTIQYAENPPKKYQDIYPLDFDSADWRSLWDALLGVVRYWIEQGIAVFRVDNPHTKPFPFWHWLIAQVRSDHPEVIFLAEAFTKPRVMRRLAQIGFTQSYTYFTWRSSKDELTSYFTELASPPSVDEMRPNAWPNTPDILAFPLQDAPPAANAARLFLAATLSPSYGIYGPVFELVDNRPAGNGKEEYLDSEKYQIRRFDLDAPHSLAGLVSELNAARRDHLALHTLRTLRFHGVDNDALLAYSKTDHRGPVVDPAEPARNPVLCVANLDPYEPQRGMVDLDLDVLGIDPNRPYEAHDLLTGQCFDWAGRSNYVELWPEHRPGHLLRISQP